MSAPMSSFPVTGRVCLWSLALKGIQMQSKRALKVGVMKGIICTPGKKMPHNTPFSRDLDESKRICES